MPSALMKTMIPRFFLKNDLSQCQWREPDLSAKAKKTLQRSSGFTLLEILFVLGLISFITVALLPRLIRPKTNTYKIVRELTVLSKDIRNSARLKQSTYRLMFAVGVNEKDYWLEVAPGRPNLTPPPKDRTRLTSQNEEVKSPFQPATSPLKGKRSLPGQLYFQQIETLSQGTITAGTGAIHFSPEGLVERSALLISDGKDISWTLLFNPLTGQVDLVEHPLALKDLETP